jgi:acetolactate synthase-1/2/3 large subunit
MRVSDWIARYLKQIGVDRVFLLSGGGMMHLIDAVAKADLPYVCCHHEQACAMAAEGYARATDRLGVAYGTSGPGATNLLTGIVGAWQDSSPTLFITGQSKRSQTIRLAATKGLRQFGTFEVDIVPIVESVTKFAHFLDDPADVRRVVEEAVHLATTGRPGPVLIDVPLDVQGALVDPEALVGYRLVPDGEGAAAPDIGQVVDRLERAERPVLLVGHGVRCGGAVPQLRAAAERLRIPVVTTQLAKDALPHDHPLFVGHCGPKGDRPGNFAVQAADLILSLGSSLHAQTVGYEADLFAPGAYRIQVDLDRAVLDRGDVPVDLRVEAEAGQFLEALAGARGEPLATGAWQEQCARWKDDYAVAREPHDLTTTELNFYEFADALSDALNGDEVIVTDAGSAFYVLGQALRCKGDQRYIVSGALGSMGYALPAALGAAAGRPDITVVCVTGDGSLQTNIQELQTLRHYGFNVKLFVISNDGYASIRNTQKGFFSGQYIGASRDSGVSLPDLEAVAASYALPYLPVRDRETLTPTLREALERSGPLIVEVHAQPEQVVIPTVASRKLANGGLRSNPLHVMHPLLPDEVLKRELGPYLDLEAFNETQAE